ncbi:adenylate/guanylate cyclase domain-containing protein [Bacteroidota bacterium]
MNKNKPGRKSVKKSVLILFSFLLCTLTTFSQKQGQELIDSILTVLPDLPDDKHKAQLLESLSFEYYVINPEKGIDYASEGLKLARELKWPHAEARFLNNLATNYFAQSNYSKALKYYFEALSINEEIEDKQGIADNLTNIGIIYHEQSDFTKALEYYEKSLALFRELENLGGIGSGLLSIGSIYSDLKQYEKALSYYTEALVIIEKSGDKRNMAFNLGNIGIVYYNLRDFEKALEYYQKAKQYFNELGDVSSEARAYGKIGKLYLEIAKDTQSAVSPVLQKKIKTENVEKAIENLEKSIEMFRIVGEMSAIKDYYLSLSEAYQLIDNHEKALECYVYYSETKDSIFNIESEKTIAKLENKRELELRDKQIEIQNLKINNQRNLQLALSGILLIMLAFIIFVIRERRRSEKLLLNVLPASIARRLKKLKGRHIADRFDHAAIVFCDIAGFTKMSSSISAEKLVEILNDIFTRFDKITDKHNMEKIKTIGDCYMAVAGIPDILPNAAEVAVNWAIEARNAMQGYKTDGGIEIALRFGVDCGPVVAGVIGEKKFIYDLWGDTVNTASRMESNGVLNEIHVTENVRNALKTTSGFVFVDRGEIEIKGKGMMHTYFVGNKE